MIWHIIVDDKLTIYQYYTQGIIYNLVKRFESTFDILLNQEDFQIEEIKAVSITK